MNGLEMPRTETQRGAAPDATARAPRRRFGTSSLRVRLVGGLVLAGLTAAILALAGSAWSTAELGRVEREIHAGRIASARARLKRLGMLGLGGVEARYWRGACEEAEGRTDAALVTWASIPPGSPRFANAVVRRAQLALDTGRFAEVEAALEPADFPRSSLAFALRERALQHVYFFTGRSDDLRRRKPEEWAIADNKAEVLRTHWQIDEPKAAPIRSIAPRLAEAARLAPEDDRVWLGKAYLAIRTARFAEAEDWLDRCQRRRPEDPVVWRARLEWAMTVDRPDEAAVALRHLPAGRFDAERFLEVRAWLAARAGDERAEREALAAILERVPGDTRALSRLAELAAHEGRSDEVARLRRRKAELDRTADAYRRFLFTSVPTGHFAELGRLAEALGRWFEARGWWTLAMRETPGSREARVALDRIDGIERKLAEADRGRVRGGARAPWPRRWPTSSDGVRATRPRYARRRRSPSSATMPGPRGCGPSTTTIPHRSGGCRR